jgi:hypothetical protein
MISWCWTLVFFLVAFEYSTHHHLHSPTRYLVVDLIAPSFLLCFSSSPCPCSFPFACHPWRTLHTNLKLWKSLKRCCVIFLGSFRFFSTWNIFIAFLSIFLLCSISRTCHFLARLSAILRKPALIPIRRI